MAQATGKWLIVGRLVWHPFTHRKVKWFSVTTKSLVQTEMVQCYRSWLWGLTSQPYTF